MRRLVAVGMLAGAVTSAGPWALSASASVPHTVQPGESLWSIAEANRVAESTLASSNGLSSNASLIVGQTITIPSSPGAVSPFPAASALTWGRTDQGVDGITAPGSSLLALGSGTIT